MNPQDECRTQPDEAGASMVEYGLLLTLIAVVAVVAVAVFGGNLAGLFAANGSAVASTVGP